MKVRRKFDIEIFKLSNKKHDYEYQLDNLFFEEFEDSLIEKGNLDVKVTLDKTETLIQTSFTIKGSVELICDRSLETFDFPIDIEEGLIFKYGEEYAELSDEIISIPRDAQKLNIAQYIYEFIGLAIPMKKLHPRFQEESESEEETDGILIYSTGKGEGSEEGEDQTGSPDPRWDILNNLKNNNN